MSKLFKISSEESPTTYEIDVVFIHGLGGDAFDTWRSSESDTLPWPYWLAEDFPQASVWSLGYSASPSKRFAWLRKWLKKSRDIGHAMPLPDRANQVLDLMTLRGFGKRPLVFVCHSLGGLLAKQILHLAYESLEENQHNIFKRARAVLFIATPHFGSEWATLATVFGKIIGTTSAIHDLREHESHQHRLGNWYRNHCSESKIITRTYFETRDLYGLQIVNKTSANPGVGFNPVPLDADHISIAKPSSRKDQIYIAAYKLISQVFEDLSKPPEPPPIYNFPKENTQRTTKTVNTQTKRGDITYLPDTTNTDGGTVRPYSLPEELSKKLATNQSLPNHPPPSSRKTALYLSDISARTLDRKINVDKNSVFFKKYINRDTYSSANRPHDSFEEFLKQEDKSIFILTGDAGKGKTCFLCHAANKIPRQKFVTVLLSCNRINLSAKDDLAKNIADDLKKGDTDNAISNLNFGSIAQSISKDSYSLVIMLDALNELVETSDSVFNENMEYLIHSAESKFCKIFICISCRTGQWTRFSSGDWTCNRIFARQLKTGGSSATHVVENFSKDEFKSIRKKYFQWFRIKGTITKSAEEGLYDPLMLRYICAAHTHRDRDDKDKPASQIKESEVDLIKSIRRKEALDTFVRNRRAAMMAAAGRHGLSQQEIRESTTLYIMHIAYAMYECRRPYVTLDQIVAIAEKIKHPDAAIARTQGKHKIETEEEAIFCQFIQEGLIIERIGNNKYSFVFEPYLEYTLGRYFATVRWPNIAKNKGRGRAVRLIADDFNEIANNHIRSIKCASKRDNTSPTEKNKHSKYTFFAYTFSSLQCALLETEPVIANENNDELQPNDGEFDLSYDHEIRSKIFVRLLEEMIFISQKNGLNWLQQACATIRESWFSQPDSWSQAVSSGNPRDIANLQRRFNDVLKIISDLIQESNFLMLWDLPPTLCALAKINQEALLGRLTIWSKQGGQQALFALHTMMEISKEYENSEPEEHHLILREIGEKLLDSIAEPDIKDNFWTCRIWILCAQRVITRSAEDIHFRIDLKENLTNHLLQLAQSKNPYIAGFALAKAPFISDDKNHLEECTKIIENSSFNNMHFWSLTYSLAKWGDRPEDFFLKSLQHLSQRKDDHLAYAIERTIRLNELDNDPKYESILFNISDRPWFFNRFEGLGNMNIESSSKKIPIIYSPAYLEPEYEDHVECRERIQAIMMLLAETAGDKIQIISPKTATDSEVKSVHKQDNDRHRDGSYWPEYLAEVKQIADIQEQCADTRNPRSGLGELRFESSESAFLSAGGVLTAVSAALASKARAAFAINRPPGHLANNMICILNNVAIASNFARNFYGKEKSFIIDFDAHHGLHTYRVFRESRDTVYFSAHIDREYSYESGRTDDRGEGEGFGYNFHINYPIETTDTDYQYMIDNMIIPLIYEFSPDIIFLSAGFDGHYEDPFENGNLTDSSYIHLAEQLKHVADDLKIKIVGTFEGGYSLDAVARNFVHIISILGDFTYPLDVIPTQRTESAKNKKIITRTKKRPEDIKGSMRERVRLMLADKNTLGHAYPFGTKAQHWDMVLGLDLHWNLEIESAKMTLVGDIQDVINSRTGLAAEALPRTQAGIGLFCRTGSTMAGEGIQTRNFVGLTEPTEEAGSQVLWQKDTKSLSTSFFVGFSGNPVASGLFKTPTPLNDIYKTCFKFLEKEHNSTQYNMIFLEVIAAIRIDSIKDRALKKRTNEGNVLITSNKRFNDYFNFDIVRSRANESLDDPPQILPVMIVGGGVDLTDSEEAILSSPMKRIFYQPPMEKPNQNPEPGSRNISSHNHAVIWLQEAFKSDLLQFSGGQAYSLPEQLMRYYTLRPDMLVHIDDWSVLEYGWVDIYALKI